MQHRSIYLIALVAGLVGCVSPEQIRQAAAQSSSFEICTNLGRFGANDHILYEELARRGENCSQYADAMRAQAQQRQAEAARAAATMQVIQAMQPPPVQFYPIQPTTNCTSRVYGNQVNTTCQ